MDYSIPNPQENPKAAIVVYYKVLAGFEFDDRSWDKINFARYMRSAKELLEVCGDFEIAKRCLEDLSKKFIDIGCEWNLRTIVNHAPEWKLRRGKNDGKNKSRFFDAVARQRADRAIENKGTVSTGGQNINSLGIIEFVRDSNGNKITGGDPKDGSLGERISPDRVEKKEIGGFGGAEGVVGL